MTEIPPTPLPDLEVHAADESLGTGPDPASPQGPRQGSAAGSLWREWVRPLLIVLFVMFFFRSALADWNDVPTGSMKPTIVEGDRIFVNKIAYDLKVPFTLMRLMEWSDPQRGDIVVLFSPDDGKRLVKRVAGVEGDMLELRRGNLFVNGEPVAHEILPREAVISLAPEEALDYRFAEEDLGDGGHTVMLAPWLGGQSSFGPIRVPEGHYFVMGDNRSHSRDSRSFGFVERKRIVGQATAVVFSLDREQSFRPRKNRFFQGLD